MSNQQTTIHAFSEYNPHRTNFQTLTYRLRNDYSLTFEVPADLVNVTEDNELYKITIEKITDKEEIEQVIMFDKLRGAEHVFWTISKRIIIINSVHNF